MAKRAVFYMLSAPPHLSAAGLSEPTLPDGFEQADVLARPGLHTPFQAAPFELSPEEKKKVNYGIMDDLLAYGDRETASGKTVNVTLSVCRASIWQYHKFRLYFDIRNLWYLIREIELLLEDYERLYVYTDKRIFKALNLFDDRVILDYSLAESKKKKSNYRNLLNYGWMAGIRFWKGVFRRVNARKQPHLVVGRPENEQPFLMLDTLETGKDNVYLGYLLQQMGPDFAILDEYIPPKLKGAPNWTLTGRHYRGRKGATSVFGEYILIRGFLSWKYQVEFRGIRAEIKAAYDKLETVSNDRFGKVVLWHLRNLHASGMYFMTRYLTYRLYFKKKRFKSLTLVDENTPHLKAVVDAARDEGIRTIALQHGTLHPLHPAYRFTAREQELDFLPEITLCWGTHWQSLLQEMGHYPEGQLGLSGQLRTDIIPRLKGLKKSDVIPELDDAKPLIVYASQPQRDPELRDRAHLDVFKAAAGLPEYQLVVKLHPREKDLSLFHRLADEAGCSNYLLVNKADLYQVISVCDVLITCFSTVGTETVYFYKPLVILDHLEQDIQGYIAEGVGYQAIDADSLKEGLEAFITGKRELDREAYARFTERYAFRIDGKVTERVLKEIRASS